MKKLIYSALIGSLALAFNVQAAQDKKEKKNHGGRGAANVQKAPGRAGGQKLQRNAHAMHSQAINRGRIRSAEVHQINAERKMQHDAVKAQRQNAKIARVQNTGIASQQNAVANLRGNLKPNRHRNVALVNNWSGSSYSGQQYSAFRDYRRQQHDRNYYQSRYNRIVLFGGGNYYWDNGYWYPAWGYDSGYRYGYDGPIYGYNNLEPQQVVVNVQSQLQQNGYYNGPVDGSLGPMTRRALAAFQADQGLAITSAIDQPTLVTLGLS